MKKQLITLVLLVFVLAGCQTKLSEETEAFDSKGISYSIQLLEKWSVDEKAKERYGQGADFGAEDTRSNSVMFISSDRLEEKQNLTDFGEQRRKQLAETYHYEDPEDLYMKAFDWQGREAYKYTAATQFENSEVWAHIYYLFTDKSVIQVVYYSADDGDYEQRSEVIEESVLSLKETGVDSTWNPNSDEEDKTSASVRLKNEDYLIDIIGFQQTESETGEDLLVVRYKLKNLTNQGVTPAKFDELIQVKQGEQVLKKTEYPKEEKETEAARLAKHQDRTIEPEASVETVGVYRLVDMKEKVNLTFSEETFPNQEAIALDLSLLKEAKK